MGIRIHAPLVATAAAGWMAVAFLMEDEMTMVPWTDPGPLVPFLAFWVAMMVAMMLPSTGRATTLYGQLRGARTTGARGGVIVFVTGYLLVWVAAGVGIYGLDGVVGSLSGSRLAWDAAGRWVAAAAFVLAAVWQVTPMKLTCLAQCRNPAGVLTRSWRDGTLGGLVLGARTGGWCLACCWALMLGLFALGAMSLVWMALVAIVIGFERLAPRPRATTLAVAGLLVLVAAAIAVAPGYVPGLPSDAGARMQMASPRRDGPQSDPRASAQPQTVARSMTPAMGQVP